MNSVSGVTVPVTTAERTAVTFALPLELPGSTGMSLVVAPERPLIGSDATAALARRSFDASQIVEQRSAYLATRRYPLPAKVLSDFATYPAAIGVMMGLMAGAMQFLQPEQAPLLTLFGIGGAGLGVVATITGATAALTKRALRRETSEYITAMEDAAAKTHGVNAAWVARRAKACLNTLALPPAHSPYVNTDLTRSHTAQRLARLASAPNDASADELREVEILNAICETIIAPPSRRAASGTATPSSGLLDVVEQLIANLELLSPATRALLPPGLRDTVVAELGREPGNAWRSKRFIEAWEGKRTPYATSVPEVAELSITDALSVPVDPALTHADAASAIRTIMASIVTSKPTQVRVSHGEIAEQVAAFFEARGLRAALYATQDAIVVSVYQAGSGVPCKAWDRGVDGKPRREPAAWDFIP